MIVTIVKGGSRFNAQLNRKRLGAAYASDSQQVLNAFLWLRRIILSGFPGDPRRDRAEALFGLQLTPFCLFVGRLIRGLFLGQLRSLFLRHEPMIAQLRGPRREI